MTCTVKKCWPDKLSNSHCGGILKMLGDIDDSPEEFLKSRSAWATAQRQSENPEFMWQVLLSQITISNFSSEEISTFKICSTHEVFYSIHICINYDTELIFKELLRNRFAVKRVSCFLCNNKTNLRRVTFSMHLKLQDVVPTGSGLFLDEK